MKNIFVQILQKKKKTAVFFNECTYFYRGYEWSPILHQACEFQLEAKIQYCKAFEGTTVATILALLSTWKGRTPRTLWPSLSCVSYGIFYLNNFDLEDLKRKKQKLSKQEGKCGFLTPLSICDEMMKCVIPHLQQVFLSNSFQMLPI